MRDRKKRNIIIGVLCCLLVFMGIGYAILSQTLTINGIGNVKGNWNVEITSITLKSQTGRATEVSSSYTNTTASFEADLYMPGDSIEYEVTVENKGNIDALLQSITPTTTNNVADIKFSHSEIDNTPLTAGKTITFTMKVEFLESAVAIPDVERIEYQLKLDYMQYDGVSAYTPAVETTEESCFMISDNGTLLSYDHSCGPDIVVPATINGIAVERTVQGFLENNGLVLAQKSEDEYAYVFMNESKLNPFIELAKSEGTTDEEIEEYKSNLLYVYGSEEFEKLNLMTLKDYFYSDDQETGHYYKVYRDTDNTIKLEESTDYNVILVDRPLLTSPGSYCVTSEDCELLKEYYRSKDPAKEAGITDNTYFEYLGRPRNTDMPGGDFYLISELNTPIFFADAFSDPIFASDIEINSIDFSAAIYMKSIGGCWNRDEVTLKKIIMPPNIEVIPIGAASAEEVIFPENSSVKVIGHKAFENVVSITIPSSVVSIGYQAFENYKSTTSLKTLSFAPNSNLIAIYGNGTSVGEGDGGAFMYNELTSLTIPKSVQYIGSGAFYSNKLTSIAFENGSNIKYIGYGSFSNNQLTNAGLGKLPSSLTYLSTNAFDNNSSLTQITLTSPTDIDGWPNGETVNGITVTYER